MRDPARFNILFLCTHNSARSIMAEALVNHMGGGRFKGFSAGSQPVAAPNPFALATLQVLNVPTDALHSKAWDAFATPDAPRMDFVLTVCDNAAGEACPVWPGQPVSAHWGVEDPSRCEGDDEAKANEFMRVAQWLQRRIVRLTSLPLGTLDRTAIEHELREIGKPSWR